MLAWASGPFTLNGLVLDKRMLTLINKIGNERLESLSTRLIGMGIIEHTGRNKNNISKEYICSNREAWCTYQTGRVGSGYE
jgi:hypothetical protein